jgi:hypothetical protein
MQNSDVSFEQTVRLECLKLLSGHTPMDCRIDPTSSLPVDNQVMSNLKTLLEHSDTLFRYIMTGSTITEHACRGEGMDPLKFLSFLQKLKNGGKPSVVGHHFSPKQMEAIEELYMKEDRKIDEYFHRCIDARRVR